MYDRVCERVHEKKVYLQLLVLENPGAVPTEHPTGYGSHLGSGVSEVLRAREGN